MDYITLAHLHLSLRRLPALSRILIVQWAVIEVEFKVYKDLEMSGFCLSKVYIFLAKILVASNSFTWNNYYSLTL